VDTVIEILSVHSSPRKACSIFDLPRIFHPFRYETGWDYWKIYVDDESDHEGHGHAYQNYGIDPREGCAVILRPDQYVSWIGAFDDYEEMDRFFSGFLKVQA
jgi:phenol 2-monooxygenase (NADPH)